MERPCRSCGFPSMGSRPCPDDDAGRCRDTAHAPADASPSPPAHDGTPRRAEADELPGAASERSGRLVAGSPLSRGNSAAPSASVAQCAVADAHAFAFGRPRPHDAGLRRWRAAKVPCRLSVQTRRGRGWIRRGFLATDESSFNCWTGLFTADYCSQAALNLDLDPIGQTTRPPDP